jgi:two-component system chemotaxis response regulator CheY
MNKVLIVDDAAFMRMMLKNILAKEGFECHEAGTGAEAVTRYAEVRPDLVTMDITMPDMDGITAVKEIKKLDAQARVLMCSAMGQQAMVMNAIQAGASDFIVKPFKPERVMEAVTKLLAVKA